MVFKMPTPKLISDPIHGMINVRPILPILETREFQNLGFKSQLGVTSIVFPAATHTRKAHSLGAYQATKVLCRRWLEWSMITPKEAEALPVFALVHDIGHYPFSHVTEPLFTISHDLRGIELVKRMKDQISQCADFDLVLSLSNHSNPLYLAVHDKNFGTEKLDYLERDGRATITDRPVGIDYLREHIYWIAPRLAIDEKAVDASKDCQDFYAKMYKNVYLRRGSVIGQRHLQKNVYLAVNSGELKLDDLSEMYDFELLGALRSSKDPRVKKLIENFLHRNLFKEAVVLRYKDFVHAERTAEKNKVVIGLDNNVMEQIADSKQLSDYNQAALLAVEHKIAKAVGLEPEDVLIVTIVSPERFKTEDISIVTSNGNLASLKERYPSHFLDLAETAKSYTAFRICAQEEHRAQLAQNAELVKNIILESI